MFPTFKTHDNFIGGSGVTMARVILNIEIEDELYSGSKIIYAENQVPNKTEFTVYPVPATDYLNIEWNGLPEECHFLLYDLAGRVYLEQVLNTKIVVKQLMPGMYFIKPLCDKQLKPSKFIKL